MYIIATEAKMEEKVKYVNESSVSCLGGFGELGHPLVYLEIKKDEDSVICPYCSLKFILRKNK